MGDEQRNDLKERFRDRPDIIASYLTDAFAENDLQRATLALNHVLRAQNVQALALEAGLRRDKLYKTFGGKVDPQLGRLLKLFAAMNVRIQVVPMPERPLPARPKLGRPPKKQNGGSDLGGRVGRRYQRRRPSPPKSRRRSNSSG